MSDKERKPKHVEFKFDDSTLIEPMSDEEIERIMSTPMPEIHLPPEADARLRRFVSAMAGARRGGIDYGREQGEREQIQRDAEAICYYCSAHDEFEPALWMAEELEPGDYRHKNKKGTGSAWCQASLIWAASAERAALMAPVKQEDFADAVRADPDMTPEQKAKWLNA